MRTEIENKVEEFITRIPELYGIAKKKDYAIPVCALQFLGGRGHIDTESLKMLKKELKRRSTWGSPFRQYSGLSTIALAAQSSEPVEQLALMFLAETYLSDALGKKMRNARAARLMTIFTEQNQYEATAKEIIKMISTINKNHRFLAYLEDPFLAAMLYFSDTSITNQCADRMDMCYEILKTRFMPSISLKETCCMLSLLPNRTPQEACDFYLALISEIQKKNCVKSFSYMNYLLAFMTLLPDTPEAIIDKCAETEALLSASPYFRRGGTHFSSVGIYTVTLVILSYASNLPEDYPLNRTYMESVVIEIANFCAEYMTVKN